MTDFVRELPGWLLAHPWTVAGAASAGLASFTSLILLNPQGRQARSFLRRRK